MGGGGRGRGGCSQDAPLEIMSSLITRLLRTAQEDNPAEVKVPPDAGARRPSVVPEVGIPGRSQLSEVGQVFLVWTPGTWGEYMLPCGHFVPVLTAKVGRWMPKMASTGRYGMVGLGRGLLREMRDGPGGRVSLLDHRGPGND